MNRASVHGSRLAWVGYDDDARRLEVGLTDWSVREYLNVPPAVHAGLMAAAAPDRYFEAHVEKSGYVSRHLE